METKAFATNVFVMELERALPYVEVRHSSSSAVDPHLFQSAPLYFPSPRGPGCRSWPRWRGRRPSIPGLVPSWHFRLQRHHHYLAIFLASGTAVEGDPNITAKFPENSSGFHDYPHHRGHNARFTCITGCGVNIPQQ